MYVKPSNVHGKEVYAEQITDRFTLFPMVYPGFGKVVMVAFCIAGARVLMQEKRLASPHPAPPAVGSALPMKVAMLLMHCTDGGFA